MQQIIENNIFDKIILGYCALRSGRIIASPGELASERIIPTLFTSAEGGKGDNYSLRVVEIFRRPITSVLVLLFSPIVIGS